MPSTRIIVFERRRVYESILAQCLVELPVDLRPVRLPDEFYREVRQSPSSIAVIEFTDDIGLTVDLLKEAQRCVCPAIVVRPPTSPQARTLLREAGATALTSMTDEDGWMRLMRTMVAEAQARLRAADGVTQPAPAPWSRRPCASPLNSPAEQPPKPIRPPFDAGK